MCDPGHGFNDLARWRRRFGAWLLLVVMVVVLPVVLWLANRAG